MEQRPVAGQEAMRERDARVNEAARREILRRDGQRSLGENLERADALIKAAYELRGAFARPGP
jgi:hypothetical protein